MFSKKNSQTMKCQLGLKGLRERHSERREPGDRDETGPSQEQEVGSWGEG